MEGRLEVVEALPHAAGLTLAGNWKFKNHTEVPQKQSESDTVDNVHHGNQRRKCQGEESGWYQTAQRHENTHRCVGGR